MKKVFVLALIEGKVLSNITIENDKKHQVEVVTTIDAPEGLPSVPMDILSTEGGLPQAGEDYYLVTTIAANKSSDVDSIKKQLQEPGFKGVKVEPRQAYIGRFIKRGLDGREGPLTSSLASVRLPSRRGQCRLGDPLAS